MKQHRISVSYTVTITEWEYKKLTELAKELGLDYDNPKPLKLIKRALQNSGDSGCLATIGTEPKS